MGLLVECRICLPGTRGVCSFAGLDVRRGELWHVGSASPEGHSIEMGHPRVCELEALRVSGGNEVDSLPSGPVLVTRRASSLALE